MATIAIAHRVQEVGYIVIPTTMIKCPAGITTVEVGAITAVDTITAVITVIAIMAAAVIIVRAILGTAIAAQAYNFASAIGNTTRFSLAFSAGVAMRSRRLRLSNGPPAGAPSTPGMAYEHWARRRAV